jgi:pentose-5-phosphate-3-epimerase
MTVTLPAPRLSVGVITADLTMLGAELEILRGKVGWAHVDVMDGVFCPQLTVRPVFVAAVASFGIPVDVLVGVDGGVTISNAAHIASWGVDVIVSGSAVFDRADPARNRDLLNRELLRAAPAPAGISPVWTAQ